MNALDIEPGTELNNSYVATRLNGYVGGYGTLVNYIQITQGHIYVMLPYFTGKL